MQKFIRHFILPIARSLGWKKFCEIGASAGRGTDEILRLPGISNTVIDPGLDADLGAKYASDPRVTVVKCNSLDALPSLQGGFDCFLIDGDHNWYTVFNELSLIRNRGLLRRGGIIFLHDVAWPYGRRDMYYQPESIPQEFRQEYETKGMIQGKSELVDRGGWNETLCNATHEGGARNGVLTAVEDFVRENPSEYRFCLVDLQYGLGILQFRSTRVFEAVDFRLLQVKALLYSIFGNPIYRIFGKPKRG
jgi:hypothetical protein